MRHHHLSDHDLVLALDGELPVRHQAAADAHLTECELCRSRRTRLYQGAELATTLYRSGGRDADRIDASREQLRAKLAGLTRLQNRSPARSLASTLIRVPRWAAAAAAALAAVLLVRIVQLSEFRLARDSASIEHGALPIASLTPGATWNLTAEELCSSGDRDERPVPDAVRLEVVRRYGMERVPPDEYELDYLITPELGGAPAAQNLWPQRFASRTWNAHVKDQLELLLPRLVCDGAIPLQTAQRDIAVDWIAAYKKYFRTDVPLQAHAHWRSGRTPALTLVSLSSQMPYVAASQ